MATLCLHYGISMGTTRYLYGIILTMVPLVLIRLFRRLVLKMNYYMLMGFIGDLHTNPPSLAYAFPRIAKNSDLA